VHIDKLIRQVFKQLVRNRESVVANSYLWPLNEVKKEYDQTTK